VPNCSLAKNVLCEKCKLFTQNPMERHKRRNSCKLISNNSSSGIMDIIVLSVSALRRCSLAGCPVAKRASALKSCKLPAVTHARLFCRLKRLFEDPKSISQQFGASNVMRWSCVRPGLLSISCQRCVIRDTAASTAQKGLPTHCSVMSCIWRTLSTGQ